ncbi:MAG: replicative DNA helicase [Cytophagales bacterium]|nr:replicative DNA helicase [Cytophagales bacterium]
MQLSSKKEQAGKKSSKTSSHSKKSETLKNDISLGMGKIPPQALEAEEAVLGAILLEKHALTEIVDILKPESFYKEAHQKIYQAILALFEKSEPVDLITITNQLREDGELESVGGPFYLTGLTTRVNAAANIEKHSRIVIQNAIKRELITIASEVLRDAYEDTIDVFDLLDKTEQNLFEVSENNIRKNYASLNIKIIEALEELEAKKDLKDGLTGVPSGFTELDRITSGWQKSDLIIIAARPGMGKTAFALTAMRNASIDSHFPVAFFSLEMSSIQLVNRLMSAEAELEGEKIRQGRLKDFEWLQLHEKIKPLTQAPIYVDDTPALSIMELRGKCRRLKIKHDIKLIIVDYLQFMVGDTNKKYGSGNREQEIASISRALKNLAKELNVPVIALSQLSRAVEHRGGDKKPLLADLRESGSLEQDADLVIFLYRPELYGLTEDNEGNSTSGLAEVLVAKHRNGQTGEIKLQFIKKFTKFNDSGYNPWGDDDIHSDDATETQKTIIKKSKINGDGENAENSESTPF